MKKGLLICIIFCVSLSAIAQPCLFDRNVNWDPFSQANKAISLPDGSWVIGGWQGDCRSSLLARIAPCGDTLWTFSSPYLEDAQWITNMEFYQGRIFAVGYYYQDDEFRIDDLSIRIFDTMGNRLNSNIFPYNSIAPNLDSVFLNHCTGDKNFCLKPSQIAIIDSDNILVSLANYLVLVHPSNWAIQWIKPFKGYINDMLVFLPYVFLATDSGLIQTDTSGNILRKLPINPVTDSYKSNSGQIYFVGDTLLFSVDTLLNITHSYSLNSTFKYWNGLTGKNGSVFMSGRGIADTSFIMAVFDSTLSLESTFPLTALCRVPVDIAASDSSIMVVNYNVPIIGKYDDSVSNAIYTNYSFAGVGYLPHSNATIVSAALNNYTNVFQLTFSFLIKNTGSDTIKEITLAANPSGGTFCVDYVPFKTYLDLSLVPGDTISLHNFGTIYSYPGDSLLFYVFSINGSPPPNQCDNTYSQFCPYIIQGIYTPSISHFKISPNPTDGILNIHIDASNGEIFSLYDLSGNLLMEQNLVNTNTQLNISTLANGLYIYSVRSANQIPIMGKLVKN